MSDLDPRLDRVPRFDDRSRQYPVAPLLAPGAPLRRRAWRKLVTLDQGQEGACVGFSWAHYLLTWPRHWRGLTAEDARRFYREAQRRDEWAGEAYEGSSVLGGAQALLAEGALTAYRWAFGVDEVLATLSQVGPVVLGLDWHEGMTRPGPDGMLRATGRVVGGHAILTNAVDPRRERVRLPNSWGPGWGLRGSAWLSFDDLDVLLRRNGDACVPVKADQPAAA